MKKTTLWFLIIFYLVGNFNSINAEDYSESKVIIWIQGQIKFNATYNKTKTKIVKIEEFISLAYELPDGKSQVYDIDKKKTVGEWLKYNFYPFAQDKYDAKIEVISSNLEMRNGSFDEFKSIKDKLDDKGLKATHLYEYVFINTKWEQWYKSGNYGPDAKYSSNHPKFNKRSSSGLSDAARINTMPGKEYDDGGDSFLLWFILGLSALVFVGAIAIGASAG